MNKNRKDKVRWSLMTTSRQCDHEPSVDPVAGQHCLLRQGPAIVGPHWHGPCLFAARIHPTVAGTVGISPEPPPQGAGHHLLSMVLVLFRRLLLLTEAQHRDHMIVVVVVAQRTRYCIAAGADDEVMEGML